MANVIMVVPATPLADEARWRCQVCGREMAYSQPISLELAAMLVGTFGEHHATHCQPLSRAMPGTLGGAQLLRGGGRR